MKKYVYIILVLCMFFLLWFPFINIDNDVAWKDVTSTCLQSINQKEYETWNHKMIKKHYRITKENYEKAIVFKHSSATEAQEIAIFYQSDPEKRKYIKKILEDRKQSQCNVFKGYDVVQSDLIEKGKIFEKGKYVFLIIHKNMHDIEYKIKGLF